MKVASILRDKQAALELASDLIVLIKIVRIWDLEKAAVSTAVRTLRAREAELRCDLVAASNADKVVLAAVRAVDAVLVVDVGPTEVPADRVVVVLAEVARVDPAALAVRLTVRNKLLT